MEPRFQHDFSSVRVHTDAEAAQSAAALGAYAYTVGHDIVFGTGQYQPDTTRGRGLLAHELAHTVQQKGMSKKLQRRLNVTGTQADVDDYLAALERVSGFDLDWTAPGPRVTIAGNTDFGTQSTTGRARLQTIINNAAQHAQLTIGTHQHRVGVGAHPGAGGGAQRIDIDDIRNLNAALPGQGDAKAFHEMVENYDANSAATLGLPAATRFGTSHAQGIEIESDVLEESTIRGRRLSGGVPMTAIPAPAGQPIGPGITYHRSIQNFTHYNLELTFRRTIAGGTTDFEIVTARRNVKTQISRRVFTGFTSGSDAIPAGAAPTLALILAELNANAARTLLIETYTDNAGDAANNLTISQRRAEVIRAWFIGNGIAQDRIAIVGRGETNFVASNTTAAGRTRNRRAVLTVHQ
jgi:outer membrane protein OmpA-like peptidoglycan-associated protein